MEYWKWKIKSVGVCFPLQIGFSVRGPGCGAPTRFLYIHDYMTWIDEVISRRPLRDMEDDTVIMFRRVSPIKLTMYSGRSAKSTLTPCFGSTRSSYLPQAILCIAWLSLNPIWIRDHILRHYFKGLWPQIDPNRYLSEYNSMEFFSQGTSAEGDGAVRARQARQRHVQRQHRSSRQQKLRARFLFCKTSLFLFTYLWY